MNDLLTSNYFLWGIFPYVCVTLFFVIPFLRMIYRPFGLTTRASGIFHGRDTLGLAAHLLHWGIFLTFFGHIAGVIGGVMGAGGWVSAFFLMATAGGLAAIAGSVIALVRRIRVPEMRAMSQPDDYIVHLFLIAILGVAIFQALVHRIWGVSFTAAPWFASLWRFQPQPELMDSAPLLTKIHVFLAFTFAAYFPFTKLIHAWTLPINYFVRPYQVLRTTAMKFRNRWEFGLVSDKSYLTYAAVVAVVGLLTIGFLLPGPGDNGLVPTAKARTSADEIDVAVTNGGHVLTGYPLFVSQCARCHGLEGQGDGPGAGSPTFSGPPRDLVSGRYRYVSSDNGVATDADLRRVIVAGLPGSGMPGFASLSEAQVSSLVEVLDELWLDRPESGARIEVPSRPETTPDLIAAGTELYQLSCASCHGERGRGDGEAASGILEVDGLRVSPRNFRRDALRSGSSPAALYRRIAAGIPDGPDHWLMPSFGDALTADEIWAIVAYMENELLPPGALVAATGPR
ncbi:respiratory nitrate reductase gamma subunit [Rhodovulum imhoffii]|uniref:Respiratory nitrate reductase gamma subunit n=1 Tax=Rhodovulum imhoffii TaxID=365340 RepID=A0A2T5BNZ1_9RHOB|nr:respiratory nitrate reductase subunit gamma [Rhodovulum imhoffii]MBK5933646.1 respiratory nitrate reductase subunit gamma [Rhodovulum imhoffii]PTN00730.1 respiratory nitrate reductase gamma subunit [Rhodovulum imhoffii]